MSAQPAFTPLDAFFATGGGSAAVSAKVASGGVTQGHAISTTSSGEVVNATTALRQRPFSGIALATAVSGQQVTVHAGGPVDRTIVNLGSGVACAVGVAASGNLVRATDPTCVSAPNWVGDCDTDGTVTFNPRRSTVFSVLDFGAVPDWNGDVAGVGCTDNLAAFNACLAAYNIQANTPQGQRVSIPCGRYFISGTIHVRQQKLIQGDGMTDYNLGGAMLVFAKNVDGIRVHSATTNDDPTSSAAYSTFRDLVIRCADGTTSSGHGFWTSTIVNVDNVAVNGFAYNGVEVSADTGYETGNASTSAFKRVRTGSCGRHGFHVYGGDASVCSMVACESSSNGGWGVLDESGLGNTYAHHHAEGNRGAIVNLTCSVDSGSTTVFVIDQTPGCSDSTNNNATAIPFYCNGHAGQLAIGQQISIAGVTGRTVTAIPGTVRAVISGNTVTAAASTKTYTRDTGSWIADGFSLNDYVRVAGYAHAGNNGLAQKITTLTATVMTCSGATLTDETPAVGQIAIYKTTITIDVAAGSTVVSAAITGGVTVDSKNHDYKARGATGNDGNPSQENYTSVRDSYSEFAINDLAPPASIEGGIAPTFPQFNNNSFAMTNGIATAAPYTHRTAVAGSDLTAQFGNGAATLEAGVTARAFTLNITGADFLTFDYTAVSARWEFWMDNNAGLRPLTFFMPSSGYRLPYSIGFSKGLSLGNSASVTEFTAIHVVASGDTPLSPAVQGDIELFNDVTAGGFVGRVCTASGSPGTWKTFGLVSL